jgi:hypothetical protein
MESGQCRTPACPAACAYGPDSRAGQHSFRIVHRCSLAQNFSYRLTSHVRLLPMIPQYLQVPTCYLLRELFYVLILVSGNATVSMVSHVHL